MSIITSSVGIAYAAAVVWLAVRFINRREWWTKMTVTVFIAFPPLYILSFAIIFRRVFDGTPRNHPVITGIVDILKMCLFCFYGPIIAAMESGPVEFRDAVEWLTRYLN